MFSRTKKSGWPMVWLFALVLLGTLVFWKSEEIKGYLKGTELIQAVVQAASAPASQPMVVAPSASRVSGVVQEEMTAMVATSVTAPKVPEVHVVASGETLQGILAQYRKWYRYSWQQLCVHNRLADCNVLKPDQTLNLVVTSESIALAKKAPASYFKEKLRYVVTDCAKTKLGYCVFSRPGGDPVCRRDQIGILSRDFSISRDVAEGWKSVDKEVGVIQAGTIIGGLSFGGGYWKGPVLVKQTMTYKVGQIGGKTVGQFDACCNYFPIPTPDKPIDLPPGPAEEPPLPPPPPASAPTGDLPEIPSEPQEVEKTAAEYDFDAIVFAGGDKDVLFSGFEGAGYPWIHQTTWGRYAVGGGGWLSLWQGKTPDGFGFKGALATFGLAQKFSFPSRRDVGLKLVYGDLWTKGNDATGRYQQKAQAQMTCVGATYTDAAREKAGATWFPEYSLSASYCDPFSQTKSHSYDGTALDSSTLKDVKYVAGVSAQLIIRKNLGDTGIWAKVQPLVEVGINQTAPNPVSGHAYVGLRTVNKVWTVGAGVHWSSLSETPGATIVYNAGRDYKLTVQEERWNEMIQSLEARGVGTD